MMQIIILVALGFVLLLVLSGIDRWWREQSYDLQGKTILITGGSRGLGLVMARQLIAAGARLAICARNATELEQAQAELEQTGGTVIALPCDVTDQSEVGRMVEQVQHQLGSIDVLINNAGMDIVGPMDALTMSDYEDTMKLHFWAPLYTTYAVLPYMRQRTRAHQPGRIVNIASIGGKVAAPHMLAYCASKFALVGLSEGLRAELAQESISVTTVCPGTIRTGVLDHVIFKGHHRQEYAWFSLTDSLPLISTSAEEVARQTIAALRRGAAEVITPLPIWIAAKFYALSPALNTALLGWANRLLPQGGIGTDRAFGRESRPDWLPDWLLTLSDRAAQRNNEISSIELKLPAAESFSAATDGAGERSAVPMSVNTPVNIPVNTPVNSGSLEDPQSAFPLIDLTQAPPEVRDYLHDIQTTLGIPWIPANWRAYAMQPRVMQLFWQRLKPATQTEAFLEDAIALTEQVYEEVSYWYQPGYQIEVNTADRQQIQRQLAAFSFGNPQLLIQQVALNRALAGEIVGEATGTDALRRGPNAYHEADIQLLGEPAAREVSPEMQAIYHDIQQTLAVPIVNSDYQALAHWPAFLIAAWEDIKRWRERPEYEQLKQSVRQQAAAAADRLYPAIVVGEQEVQDALAEPLPPGFERSTDVEQIHQTVQMFEDVLIELIVQNALFHLGVVSAQPVSSA